jgi:transmembrane sensor
MSKETIEIANRFLAEEGCSIQELEILKKWLSDRETQSEVEGWLLEHWTISTDIESTILLETIFEQINEYQNIRQIKSRFSAVNILRFYQKVAAFLLIPIIGVGILYWVSQYDQSNNPYTETFAPRGQKSQIVLTDGTKVWLNSETKIKYPDNFNKSNRDVYLEGEAFFEVTKNEHQPFVVHTSGIDVKVLGTKFNVKAYPDENEIETSLFEGKINLIQKISDMKYLEKEVSPGHSLVFNKKQNNLTESRFPEEEICGWKNNQLIFKDDTFVNLVRKMERWYDVKVIYDEKLFSDRRLTVELYEGERLEKLMEIISLTLSVDYKYLKSEIIITPKSKNM